MLRSFKQNNRGYFTVEAAITFTTVLVTVIVLIFICMMLYRQSYVQTIADRAAERGVEVWQNPAKDMFMSQITTDKMKDTSLYWRITDSAKKNKKSKIKEFANYLLNTDPVFSEADNIDITAQLSTNYVIYQKLRVTASAKYKIPGGGFLRLVGLKDYIILSAESEAVINQPSEFIRNTDFIVDTLTELDNKTGNKVSGTVNDLSDPLKKKITGMLSKLQNFADK